jgi:hypothetical protein
MVIFDQIEEAKIFFFTKISIPINTEGYKEAHGVALSIMLLTFLYVGQNNGFYICHAKSFSLGKLY